MSDLLPMARARMLPGPDGSRWPVCRWDGFEHMTARQVAFMVAYINERYSSCVLSAGGTPPYTWSTGGKGG